MKTAIWLLVIAATPEPTVTVWSYQTEPIRLIHCHTWATFERGGETFTISWYPSGDAKLIGGRPQPGKNMSHAETLAYAQKSGAKIRSYGPHPLTPEQWQQAKQRHDDLQAGKISYVTQSWRRDGCNCIQALAGAIGPPERYGLLMGDIASRDILRHIKKNNPAP